MPEGCNKKYFIEFGEKLRLARESIGLEIVEIARRLLVNKQRVIEIENGDYSNITSSLYLRWYLSSYAKILGLSEHEIPSILEEFVNDEDQREVSSVRKKFNKEDGIKSSSKFYKILFLSLIAVLVLYWPNRERDNEQIHHLISYLQQKIFMQRDTNE
jgi:cytoskeleton protein RodZ